MGVEAGPNIVNSGLVLSYDAANVRSFRGAPTTNYLSNPTQTFNSSEFQQYYDLRAIFETNGLVPYSLSFDARADKPGWCLWYMQNGSYTKYAFVYNSIDLTTRWQRFTIENVTPSGPTAAWQANTPSDNRAMLATYTGYGSGVYPQVKNIQLELGTVATPFVDGTRGTTNATGGGWVDLSGNNYHGELANGPTYNSSNGGSIVFDGSNDYIDTGKTASQLGIYDADYTCSAWVYPTSLSSDRTMFGTDQTALRQGMHLVFRSGGIYQGHYSSDFSAGTVDVNNWYHITYTYVKSSGTATIYKNGVSQGSGTISSFIGTTNIRLGRWAGGYNFSGNGASYCIWNRALSAAEVLQNFNATRARFGV